MSEYTLQQQIFQKCFRTWMMLHRIVTHPLRHFGLYGGTPANPLIFKKGDQAPFCLFYRAPCTKITFMDDGETYYCHQEGSQIYRPLYRELDKLVSIGDGSKQWYDLLGVHIVRGYSTTYYKTPRNRPPPKRKEEKKFNILGLDLNPKLYL